MGHPVIVAVSVLDLPVVIGSGAAVSVRQAPLLVVLLVVAGAAAGAQNGHLASSSSSSASPWQAGLPLWRRRLGRRARPVSSSQHSRGGGDPAYALPQHITLEALHHQLR